MNPDKCCTCGKEVTTKDGRKRYSPEEFQKDFNIGDLISGWSTGLTLQITAIGKKRILLWDESRKKERTALQSAQHGWVRVNRTAPRRPKHYGKKRGWDE